MERYSQEPVYIIAAKRNPFGAYGGALAHLSAIDLGVHAAKAALMSVDLAPDTIDHVIFGNVLQSSKDAIYLARHIGLKAGIPEAVPALTVNRLCGSGFEAIIQGARLIAHNEASSVLVGGSENLSLAPHIIRGARRGLPLGQGQLEDSLWESLNDTFINMPMALTAELLAEEFVLTQDDVDAYCVESQQRYQKALSSGVYNDEIAVIECGTSRRPKTLAFDEHARADTTLEGLRSLAKVFKQDGVIHAAAASGISDGAAALILGNSAFVKTHRLRPLAELTQFAVTGCDPRRMGLGPVSAIKTCLSKAKCSLADMAMLEINEAFAPQVLACIRMLDCHDNLNIHGGALAIGHPLAASGARIVTHLVHALKGQKQAYGLGAACIGGGQGIAVMVRSL